LSAEPELEPEFEPVFEPADVEPLEPGDALDVEPLEPGDPLDVEPLEVPAPLRDDVLVLFVEDEVDDDPAPAAPDIMALART